MNHVTMAQPLALLGLSLVLMAPMQAAVAFGGVGNTGECTSFTSCTAGVSDSAFAQTQYNFTSITGSYQPPPGLTPGLNTFQDFGSAQTGGAQQAAIGGLCVNCAFGDFHSSAVARSQSDFGVSRAFADTSVGAVGTDDRGNGSGARVQVQTIADARSAWRDVWSFDADGHFSATVALDGHSDTPTGNAFFPSTFSYGTSGVLGNWFYELDVWDVSHLSPDSDGFPGPTLVARAKDGAAGANEQRASFASSLALDFDFVRGASYVVTAELGIQSRNGRQIDLYNTARLGSVALSNGASLSALSGHDYVGVSPAVPEPQTWALFGAGLLGLTLYRRRQRGR